MQLHVEEMTPEEIELHTKRTILKAQLRGEAKAANDGEVFCTFCKCKLSNSGTRLSHIIPLSQGGETVAKNAVLSCQSCCDSKRARPLNEWCSHLMVMQGEIQQLMATRTHKAEKPAA
ncbi:HNH endonuclease [Planctomicrobium sp. SH527]|uniref:HNH endonuclease n=1 Tax=Planctomicrobium sp. SH527 TaxID=3448123 RepID=UPI003F5BF26E